MIFFIINLVLSSVYAGWYWNKNRDATPFAVWAVVVGSLLPSTIHGLYGVAKVWDTETLNGFITGKEIVKQDCDYPGWRDWPDSFCTNENTRRIFSHYERVCTGTGSNRSCNQVARYKTQYSYDYPWEQKFYAQSTLGGYTVDRVDPQGATTPPRYASVYIGEPVSDTASYKNYLLVSGANIHNPANRVVDPLLLSAIPPYPQQVYDYYRMDRFVQIGTALDGRQWNLKISDINSRIGPSRQANLIVVTTSNIDRDIRNAIYKAWNGGKKNDVIIILALVKDRIEWAETITFLDNTGNEFMASRLASLAGRTADLAILDDIGHIVSNHFDRKPMESVSYLMKSYSPPVWVAMLAFVLGLLSTLGILFIHHKGKHLS